MDLDNLKPKKFLGLGTHKLPHVGDLSKPFFVTIGCSLTEGRSLDYNKTWSSSLSRKINLEHVNLAMAGSSLDYQYDTLIRSENILNDAKFVVWMHTYPTRFHLTFLRHIIGDRLARRGHGRDLQYDNKYFEKIKKFVFLTKDKKVLHTNAWGYDNKMLLVIEKLICRNNKKYVLNRNGYLDRACDGEHAGPKSHEIIARDLYEYISQNFPDWCYNTRGI